MRSLYIAHHRTYVATEVGHAARMKSVERPAADYVVVAAPPKHALVVKEEFAGKLVVLPS